MMWLGGFWYLIWLVCVCGLDEVIIGEGEMWGLGIGGI